MHGTNDKNNIELYVGNSRLKSRLSDKYTFSANVRHPTGAGETKVLGRFFWRPIFTIENCLRNYWKLPSSFALIDVSLNSLAR